MFTSPSLRVIQQHFLAILVIGVVAMGAAYAASFLITPTYLSGSRVLVRARDVRYLNSNGQDMNNQPGIIDSVLAKALTETSSGLVQSQAVAQQVVDELHLDQPKPQDTSLLGQLRSGFKQVYKVVSAYVRYGFYAEPPAYDGAVASVQTALAALPVKDSYLIDIQAKADDPELAAAIANSATRAFVSASRSRVQQEADRYRGFLKDEVDNARKRVDDAQAAVRSYKETQGVTSLDDQLKLSASGLDDGRKTLDATDAQLRDAQARLDALQASIGDLRPTDVATTSVEAHNSSTSPQTVATQSQSDGAPNTSTIETGRSRTTTTVDPVTMTQRSNTTTQASTEQSNSETHTSTSPSRVYQDLQTNQLSVQAEIAGLQARRDALSAALNDRVKAGQALPGIDQKLAELQLQVTASTSAYTTIRGSYESATLNAAQQAEEVSPIDQAKPPLYPDKPWRWLFGAVGLLLGLSGGAGLALLIKMPSASRWSGRSRGRAPSGPAIPAVASSILPPTARTTDPQELTGPSPA